MIELAGKQVFSVAEGALLICLDKQLTQEVIDAMADMEPSRVICLDAGFQGNDRAQGQCRADLQGPRAQPGDRDRIPHGLRVGP